MPNLEVPLDIVELIMEELAKEEDIETLKTCSLACRHFRPICQRRIFAAISLDFSKRHFRKNPLAPRFRRLVDRNPSIVGYVRSLDYVDLFDSKRGAPVLRRFRHIKSFTFGFNDYDPLFPPQQDWEKMTISLRTSLHFFIQANNIVELCLFNIQNLPMSFLLHFPALLLLDMFQVAVAHAPFPITFPGKRVVPKISSLIVRTGSLSTVWELLGEGGMESGSILDLTNLSELSVSSEDSNAMEIVRHILKTTENIKTVSLSGEYPALNCLGNITSVLTSGSLRTLKTIQLSPLLETANEDPYLDLTKELEVIAGKNVLEQIILDINIETDSTCSTDPTKWAYLDNVLSSKDGFPFLHRVEVKITFWCYCEGDHEEFLRKMWDIGRNKFPWLASAKQIEFKFDVIVGPVI